MPLQPRQPTPPLSARLTDGGTFTLGDPPPDGLTLMVFFRGLHCPICNTYLNTLQSMLPAFTERGVDVVALSMESAERTQRCKDEWGLDRLKLGHGVDEATAQDWGLYLTHRREGDEPPVFTEPGLFVIGGDGTLAGAVINTGPRLRPDLGEVLAFIDSRLERSRAGTPVFQMRPLSPAHKDTETC